VGWVWLSTSAARPKLPSSAIRMKVCSNRRSIEISYTFRISRIQNIQFTQRCNRLSLPERAPARRADRARRRTIPRLRFIARISAEPRAANPKLALQLPRVRLRTSGSKRHWIIDWLVSFDSEVRIGRVARLGELRNRDTSAASLSYVRPRRDMLASKRSQKDETSDD
jgi:hypothetical protein